MTSTDVEGPIKAFSFGSKKNKKKNQIIHIIPYLKKENISKKIIALQKHNIQGRFGKFIFLSFFLLGGCDYLKPYKHNAKIET